MSTRSLSHTLPLEDRGSCPLCGADRHRVHIDFPSIPIHQCLACAFLYSAKLMPAAELTRYYASGFGGLRHWQGQQINARINAAAIARLLGERLPRVRRVLDVGTGYGFLLGALQRLGMETTGVELSRQEADYGRETLGLDIRATTLEDAGLARGHFDLVTAFEVIEHVANPRSFLTELLQYLKPAGFCVLMTDNFDSDVVRTLGPGFPKWIPHTHISHFAPATLERTMTDAGLEVIGRLSYTPWELVLRGALGSMRRSRGDSAAAFDLERALATEMQGPFRGFALRQRLNPLWARASARRDLAGALMYVLARPRPAHCA